MESADIQQLFFQKIKDNMPAHLSFVDEIAELLNISNDSVYRRIPAKNPSALKKYRNYAAIIKFPSISFCIYRVKTSFLPEG
jgi:predicted DNA-binding protein YlxM (UPF0122 family)